MQQQASIRRTFSEAVKNVEPAQPISDIGRLPNA